MEGRNWGIGGREWEEAGWEAREGVTGWDIQPGRRVRSGQSWRKSLECQEAGVIFTQS